MVLSGPHDQRRGGRAAEQDKERQTAFSAPLACVALAIFLGRFGRVGDQISVSPIEYCNFMYCIEIKMQLRRAFGRLCANN